ncbi:MAG: copper oxidase [Acidobacteria bacterium]|nr:MAG: copper oxidase [Acidobacteriota bacterium]
MQLLRKASHAPLHGARRRARPVHFLVLALLIAGASVVFAALLDPDFGPPPPGDPSEFTGPLIGEEEAIDNLELLEPANEGAFAGGPTGTSEDAGINNSVPENQQNNNGGFDVPTGGPPSPMFGAGDWEQQMLRFEEFGTEPLATAPAANLTFPRPTLGPAPEQDPADVAASCPDGVALEAFLAEPGISPTPQEFSKVDVQSPWVSDISGFLGRAATTPAEGRPPGRGWAHQRWNEFQPQVFFKTAQAGSRVNHGFRDSRQLHGYNKGEFAPGGLYHRVFESSVDPTVLDGTTNGLPIRFHPNMPIQDHKALWTFDGTLPPKLLMARYGQAILMRHYNALPIDPAANRGFGLHTITTHEHNGHSPAESDGYTNAFFFPGQFYDYRWPLQLAGYDTINTTASDPRAAFPCAPGETLPVADSVDSQGMPILVTRTCDANGRIQIRGDWRETMSTHWFHDHMLDFTAQNVYKGNAVMMNYYSALDRGNEAHDDGVNLRFPSGTALPWGNRDYDVNLAVFDKAWDTQGQLWFNIFNLDGFIGDRVMVNWLWRPYFEVRARRYRFRILNASVSRYFAIALVRQIQGSSGEFQGPPGSGVSYDRVPFHMIANDGNIMEHAVRFDASLGAEHNAILPTQGIAERYDIIVDFAAHGIQPGDKLYFVNVLEHTNGKVTDDKIPLKDILDESYKPVVNGNRWEGGDPGVGKFLEFRVVAYNGTDLSMDPSNFEPGGQKMIPLPIDRNDPQLANALHRTFKFGRSSGTDEAPWTIKTDGGAGLGMDPRRLSAAPRLATGPTPAGFDGTNANGDDAFGTMEIWHLTSGGGWSHPVHVHFEEGVILTRGGEPPPEWEKWARKDVYRLGPQNDSTDEVEFAIRFREFAGTYMEHCHNTQHEDHAMLLRWDIEHPGQVKLMPAPIPTWDGVEYVDSAALPTFRTGDGTGPETNFALTAPSTLTPTKVLGSASPAPAAVDVAALNVNLVRHDAATGALRVTGTAPANAGQIFIHAGEPNGELCSGALIGTASVGSDGRWVFGARLAKAPATICARAAGVGDDSLRVNARVSDALATSPR